MLSFSAFLILAFKTALIIAFIYFTFIRKRRYTILPENPLIFIINILGILYLTELAVLIALSDINKEAWQFILTPAIHDIFIPVGIVIIYFFVIKPYIDKQQSNITLINDNIQEAIIVMNLGGDIYYTNKTAEKMFGYTKNEIHKIRSNTLLTLPNTDNQNNTSWLNLKTLTNQSQTELEGHRKDGTVFQAKVMTNSVITGNKVMFVSIIQDISEQKQAEEKLQKIAKQFRDFFYLNPEACTISTLKGVLIDVNQATIELSEYSREELIGKNVSDIPAWMNHEDQLEIFRELIRTGKIHSKGTKFRKKSGNISEALYSAQIIEVDGENMILSITRDITERKKMEADNEYLASLVQSAKDAIIGIDDNYTVLSWNSGAEKIYGYTAKEMVGKSIKPIIPDEQLWNEKKEMLSKVKNGSTIENHETRRLRKDGTIIDVSLTISAIRDKHGDIISFSSITRDITERKRIEEKLRKSEQRYKLISENTDDVIWLLSLATHKFTFVSPSVYKLRGYTPEEVMDQTMQEALTPESLKQISKKLEMLATLKKEDIPQYNEITELDQPRKDGSIVSTEVATTILTNADGVPTEILGITRDITERKKAEKQLKQAKEEAESANRAKSDFLAHMSHEIRTPMNTTLGAAELLSETKLTKEQQQYVDMFKRSSEHLLSLINDILDISKIESGHLELEHIDFDICKLCDELIDIMKVKAKDKNLYVKYTTLQNCPQYLIGDPHRLNQILINLVGNAIKFTQNGSITISIEQTGTTKDKNKTELLFKIKDTGIGIPAERMGTIFQSFSQGDTSTSRQYGGTGLGLSISKKLVELMGGKIWVESEMGKGSTFCFTAVFGISEQNYQPPLPETKKAHLDKNLSILLVDDSEDNREIIKLYLRDQPVKIETAENGVEAIDRIKTNTYDVILMDLQMPIMDGYTATIAIREWEKANNKEKTPIVALSANAFREHQQRAFEAGCDNYIVKPVKKGKLIEILTTI